MTIACRFSDVSIKMRYLLALLLLGSPLGGQAQTPEEVFASKADVWTEQALKLPAGPSYEFFASLLPPPRYVNADFRDYPIVLSAPGSPAKARLISNGSGLNLRGGTRSWHDIGTPLTFRLGIDELRFGEYPDRLTGPRYAEGYLPVVQLDYAHGEAVYRQEAFASVDPALATNGVVLVRFSLAAGMTGTISAQVDSGSALTLKDGSLRDAENRSVIWCDPAWKWTRQRLTITLQAGQSATLAVPLQPMDAAFPHPLRQGGYDRQRQLCVGQWQQLVQRGTRFEVPEARVNDAARALVIGNFMLLKGDRMHYSAGNQYDQLYEAEGSDAARAMLLYGYTNEVRRMIVPLLDFTRKGLEYHQAGHKLQLLVHYYRVTGDRAFLREMQPRWEKELALILKGRTNEHGLFPRERYCGDVPTPIYSLNSNAKCWRALRDFAAVLTETGEPDRARECLAVAVEFRQRILAAVDKSERKDVAPAFIPIALLGEETPYAPITSTKIGSYWNLMANYVIGTEIFGLNSERETALVNYLQQQGGLCLGMTRSRPSPSFWTGMDSVNPLYGLRYVLTLLRRDEPDRALASFYGMLAQGFTRDTFITGEGSSLRSLDEHGRLFYCPPNSAGNAHFMWMLRTLLVQDWDLNEDGRPDTLRLLFATPRPWLEDGKRIVIERAPTEFGEVSLTVDSQLQAGKVVVRFTPPPQAPAKTLLRLRLPAGWTITQATAGNKPVLLVSPDTADVTAQREPVTLEFSVKRQP